MEKALGKVLQLSVNNGRMTEAGRWERWEVCGQAVASMTASTVVPAVG